jgi:proteasome accessory factor A
MQAGDRTRLCGEESLLNHLKGLTPFVEASLQRRGYIHAGQFLANGGRFYIDRGAHPEYATPECASVRQIVAYEKAGDLIAQELVEEASAQMAENGIQGRLLAFKNNVDSFGTTYGSHENYLVTPAAMDGIRFMVPFLVTRQIFAGAGRMVSTPTGSGSPYVLAQRSDFITRVFSDRTSEVRGIVNLRKREICREGQKRRLHLLVGDSNMSEHAIALKVGTTALVLRVLEEEGLRGFPALSAPTQAIREIAHTMDAPLALEDRPGRFTALDIQCMCLDAVNEFCSSHETDPEDEEILAWWGSTLDGLRKLKVSWSVGVLDDDPTDLKRRVDWVMKLWLISRFKDKTGSENHDPRLKALDVKYHSLDPRTSLSRQCAELELSDRVISESDIRKARTNPPDNTRAATRGAIIQRAAGKNVEVLIKNWEAVNVIAQPQDRASIHPFERHRRMVRRMKINLEDPLAPLDESVIDELDDFIQSWSGKRPEAAEGT